MTLQLAKISKYYGNHLALSDFQMKAKPGDIIGLLGANGAGKSTLLKIIAGSLQSSKGDVYIDDQKLQKHHGKSRKNIAYLAEENPLYEDLYVWESLRFFCSLQGLKNKKERIQEVLVQTGMESHQNKKIAQLSKGYKQRLGLAQALLHDPKILLLDEPFSGLDPNQLEEIRTFIKQIGKDKIIIFSSHILQEVSQICNRVVMIHQGKLIVDESFDEFQLRTRNNLRVQFANPYPKSLLAEIGGIKIDDHSLRITEGLDQLELRNKIFNYSTSSKNPVFYLESEKNDLSQLFSSLSDQK